MLAEGLADTNACEWPRSKQIGRIDNKYYLTVSQNRPAEKAFHPVQGATERFYENILLAYKPVHNECHCMLTDLNDDRRDTLTLYWGEWAVEQAMEAYKGELLVSQLKELSLAAPQDSILSDIDSPENLGHGKSYNQ